MELMRDLVESQLSNVVWVVLTLVATFTVAYLKERKDRWVEPILYGLATFTLLIVVGVAIRVYFALPTRVDAITTDNIEQTIQRWTNEFSYGIKRRTQSPERRFGFEVTVPNGITVQVFQLAARPAYLTVHAQVTMPAEWAPALTREVLLNLHTEFIRDLNKAGVQYELEPDTVGFARLLYIGPDLTSLDYFNALREISGLVTMVRYTACLRIPGATCRIDGDNRQ